MINRSIYIIEDDTFLREVIIENLTGTGNYKIKGFTTAESCLDEINCPDLVILDYYLNKENPYAMNGMEALKRISEISPESKIIILSSQENLNIANELLDNGAHDYIIKDIDAIKILQKKINLIFGM